MPNGREVNLFCVPLLVISGDSLAAHAVPRTKEIEELEIDTSPCGAHQSRATAANRREKMREQDPECSEQK